MSLDDCDLPRLKRDQALMFPPGPVLRKQAWPMLPVGHDVRTADPIHLEHLRARAHGMNHLGGLMDDQWVLRVARDPQGVDGLVQGADASVAEIQAEQVGVSLAVEVAGGCTSRTIGLAGSGNRLIAPVTKR